MKARKSVQLRTLCPTAFAAIVCLGALFVTPALAQFRVKVSVPATAEWFNTGVYLETGDTAVLVEVNGGWVNAAGSELKGPDGWGGPHEGTYLGRAPLAGLIGRVGESGDEMFYVDLKGLGSEGRFAHKAARSGTLFLAMNDVPGTYSDNQGAMNVTIMPSVPRIPNLTGMAPDEADRLLRGRFHLTLVRPLERVHSEHPEGRIFRQKPAPGTPAADAGAVSVVVSNGPAPQPVLVPDLTGMTPEDADRFLRSRFHLAIAQPVAREHSEQEAGKISSQDPAAGTPAADVGAVRVRISDGPAPVGVPPIIGMAEGDALVMLSKTELKGERIQPTIHSPHPRGTVLETEPKVGTLVPRGSEVNYTTASGRNIVPDVSGKSQADASTILKEAGFSTGTVSQRRDGARVDRVISSNPPENSVADLDSPVALTMGVAPAPPTISTDTGHSDPPITDSVLFWIVIGVITAAAATTAVFWPKIRWSVDLCDVSSRAPAVDTPVAGPEISFRIETAPGRQPGEFSTPVTKEE